MQQIKKTNLDSGKVRTGEADTVQQGEDESFGQKVGTLSFEPEFK